MTVQRLKEMKQMQRDPMAASKARRAERKADEKSGLITIKPLKLDSQPASSGSGGGFKKGGFKSAFGGPKDDAVPVKSSGFKKAFEIEEGSQSEKVSLQEESDTEDEGYEYYDPRQPTGCQPGCPGR
ncbi:hypothetical protein L228DRAFT_247055 [Xylona heveae TC161]|uniref:Uncharacterized protein n=1 Tax=Xylona heveae (strain CBS 132557 / TC161) TaxID=1328760 RepID=A0A165GWJ6_XYLHT|nr:hypothetical protein L228DRAFT_247055 [Xylona heveae TC161]KZF22689.1 hypothetical protein L228DRAFT_247055 [Xylona heveae TC161]